MKRTFFTKVLALTAIVMGSLTASGEAATTNSADKLKKTFKNVIIMIPDGCGLAHFTLARWYKQEPLACDALNIAQVKTYCSNSYITDSAPAATAFATGYKTHDKYIATLPGTYILPELVLPEGMENMPIATVLEGARLDGRATGIIATSTTSHATPADFTSHWYARSNESIIMEQQVYSNLDVLFGGGRKYITTTANSGSRADEENLRDSLVSMGYTLIESKSALDTLSDTATGKVWGHFNKDAMGRDIDRSLLPAHNHEPSLAKMTDKAIKRLSNSAKGKDKGFFLMVEGSQVDWASHANEPVGTITEYLAFDSAVAVAVKFAETDGNTLIMVVSDHDNGGLSLGNTRTDETYSSRHIDSLITPSLKSATMTAAGIEEHLGSDRSSSAITTAVSTYYGISDLTTDEISAIAASPSGKMEYVLGPIMSKRTDIGWTTTGHTGNDVPLYYFGTDDQFKTLDNTDVAKISAKAMGIDLAAVNAALYQDAATLFTSAVITIDTIGVNVGKGSMTIVKDSKTAIFPLNKNEMHLDGVKKIMSGLTVYSYKNGKVYIPADALTLFTGTASQSAPAPLSFALDENYPNPFNPTTAISFSLPKEGAVAVKIFDSTGSLVKTLVDGNLKAGSHKLNWNAKNMPSGVYVCKLIAGKVSAQKTITLVKKKRSHSH